MKRSKQRQPGKVLYLDGNLPDAKGHKALYPKDWHGIKLLVDDQEYTLDQLIDAFWEAREVATLLGREIDAAIEATIRIYGQPPYEGCSLSEYLEIVADGELDAIRAEFEELNDEHE